jgi:enamine deaminase RidA (YjgF/YER057c/UK114 family)
MSTHLFYRTLLVSGLSFMTLNAGAQSTITGAESRLKERNITLITPVAPTANFVKAVQVGNMVYLSGHGPDKPEGGQVTGKLGSDLTVDQGQQAARLVGISLLSSLKKEIGSLDKVKRVVKVLGMVNADPSFTQHSQVMNGFSDLMVEVFGESGKHARSSVGMSSLPGNIPVEIEMIVQLK